jgi:hypothetical protein
LGLTTERRRSAPLYRVIIAALSLFIGATTACELVLLMSEFVRQRIAAAVPSIGYGR